MIFTFKLSVQLLVLILVASTWAYPPECHVYYGRPLTLHCNILLQSMLREAQPSRFFSIAGLERPPEISLNQVSALLIQRRAMYGATAGRIFAERNRDSRSEVDHHSSSLTRVCRTLRSPETFLCFPAAKTSITPGLEASSFHPIIRTLGY
jgi:hypothetical protein